MTLKPFIFAAIAAFAIIFLFNPSGNSWEGKATLSLGDGSPVSWFWAITGGAAVCFLLVMLIYCSSYLMRHKLRAAVFFAMVGGTGWLMVDEFERRGASIMTENTLIYCITVVLLCFAMALTMAMKDENNG